MTEGRAEVAKAEGVIGAQPLFHPPTNIIYERSYNMNELETMMKLGEVFEFIQHQYT